MTRDEQRAIDAATLPRRLRLAEIDRRAPAADLYRSDWFRRARTYVEETGERWYVLSAGHFPILHLCNVDAVIVEDMLIIMAYLAENATVYADQWGYRDAMGEIWRRYRDM